MFLNELRLVNLAVVLKTFESLVGVHFISFKRQILFDNFLHFRFYLFKNIGSKGYLRVKIVIEAIIYCGADSKLCIGIKALDSLRKNMRSRMPESLFTVQIVAEGNDFKRAVLCYGGTQVAILAVYSAAESRLVKSHTDALCDFGNGNAAFKLFDIVSQSYFNHTNFSFQLKKKSTPSQILWDEMLIINIPRFHPYCRAKALPLIRP